MSASSTSRIDPPGSGVITRPRRMNGGAAGSKADVGPIGPIIGAGYGPEVKAVLTTSWVVTGFATSPSVVR